MVKSGRRNFIMRNYEREIGSSLSVARNQTGLSVKKFLAQIPGGCKITSSQASSWEAGLLPPLRKCEEIARVYNIDAAKLRSTIEEALETKKRSFRRVYK
jgi:hypothetical protein